MENTEFKNFTETDIDLIKTSLKTYLKSQDIFKDYNFDGSAMSLLLDLLSYNTQYNAYYVNMLASEKFINTAQKRKSLVELANNFGYIPKSTTSSTAYLSFDIVQDVGYTNSIILPKNLEFSTTVDGVNYRFLTTSSTVVKFNTTTQKYHVDNLEVKEGRYFKHKFIVSQQNEFYEIPNKGVDISRISVYVKPNTSISDEFATEYKFYNSVLDVDGESLVYYIQETDNEKHQIYFGDGILGKKLDIANQVIIEYYVSVGSEANGANQFILNGDVTGLNTIKNVSVVRASNGAEMESMNSIRLSVRDSYKSQNRAVVPADFKLKLRDLITDASDINVWGGETATPKQYGKVFISAIKDNFMELSSIEKTAIENKLKADLMVLSITPEFVDVNLPNLEITVNFKLSQTNTKPIEDIRTSIVNVITTDIYPIISKFNAEIYESKVEEFINYSDKSIVANTTRFRIYYNISNIIVNKTINKITFPTGIEIGSLVSSPFLYNDILSTIVDDGKGNASIQQNGATVLLNVLSINYDTGIVSIKDPDLLFDIINTKSVLLYIKPNTSDIIMTQNNILKVIESDIKVNN